jgi:hypothetical protein
MCQLDARISQQQICAAERNAALRYMQFERCNPTNRICK